MGKLALLSALVVLAVSIMLNGTSFAQPAGSSTSEFSQIAAVLRNPRCLNCHVSGQFARQGDDRHPHLFNVVRGTADLGAAGMQCKTCHGDHNNDASGVPGAPNWGLAPIGQQWETLDDAGLCRELIDPKRNGGRDLAGLEHHFMVEPLAQWAWNPGLHPDGTARSQPVIGRERFHALIHLWIEKGAPCPS